MKMSNLSAINTGYLAFLNSYMIKAKRFSIINLFLIHNFSQLGVAKKFVISYSFRCNFEIFDTGFEG